MLKNRERSPYHVSLGKSTWRACRNVLESKSSTLDVKTRKQHQLGFHAFELICIAQDWALHMNNNKVYNVAKNGLHHRKIGRTPSSDTCCEGRLYRESSVLAFVSGCIHWRIQTCVLGGGPTHAGAKPRVPPNPVFSSDLGHLFFVAALTR